MDVIARNKIKNKNFEILVNVDKALELKQGKNIDIREVLSMDGIFSDSKKGLHVSEKDLEDAFGTKDVLEVAGKIIKEGEIQKPLEYKKKEQENKIKQVIDFLSKYSINPETNTPHTPTRIEEALKQAGLNIDNRPIEEQISKIVSKLKEIIPIKIQTKKIRIQIPAEHTGKVYGLISGYKENEEWLSDGSLQCNVNIPSGLQGEFYDKLNSITHGSALTEEVKE